MKFFGAIALPVVVIALLAVVSLNGLTAPTAAPAQATALTDKSVEAIALQWFGRMRTGQIDRTQLTDQFSALLTRDAVQKVSAFLNKYKYGASPITARIMQTRIAGDQIIYDVKLIFPRGDSASLVLGFDENGKITGIALSSVAGE